MVGQFTGMVVRCFDGAERTVDDASCKTTSQWLDEARNFCDGHCSGDVSCEERVRKDKDSDVIRSVGTNDVKFKVLGSDSTYGASKQKVAMRLSVSTDGGGTWSDLYGARAVDGSEEETIYNVPSTRAILLRMNGRYSWLFNKTYRSDDKSGHIVALRAGDTVPKALKAKKRKDLPLPPVGHDRQWHSRHRRERSALPR